ncbi:hypothetical protein WR25_17567 [Diploscapter pachys]|uniref:Glutaredoxin domain-containing protein n=1 Tax=Diploscapter pachys TaxID=2018661 RepID=A0A2A2KQF7_9BILA|nr:hypothetical protein WR25_17567 [Diploscapter pachys]
MGNTVTNRVNVEAITKQVDDNPVMMYTRENCQFCTQAKQLLFEENIKYKECDLDLLKRESKSADYSGIVNGLVYKTSVTSVPQNSFDILVRYSGFEFTLYLARMLFCEQE